MNGFPQIEDEEMRRSQIAALAPKIDQYITCHSIIRDRCLRWSSLVGTTTLFSSAALTFLAIANDQIKSAFLPNFVNADYLISFLAFLILCGTLAELQFKWKDRASSHSEAAASFSRLKLLFAQQTGVGADKTLNGYVGLKSAYDNICDMTAKLPDNHFLQLKAAHKRKKEISVLLDKHPHMSIWLTKIKLSWRDNFGNRNGE